MFKVRVESFLALLAAMVLTMALAGSALAARNPAEPGSPGRNAATRVRR